MKKISLVMTLLLSPLVALAETYNRCPDIKGVFDFRSHKATYENKVVGDLRHYQMEFVKGAVIPDGAVRKYSGFGEGVTFRAYCPDPDTLEIETYDSDNKRANRMLRILSNRGATLKVITLDPGEYFVTGNRTK